MVHDMMLLHQDEWFAANGSWFAYPYRLHISDADLIRQQYSGDSNFPIRVSNDWPRPEQGKPLILVVPPQLKRLLLLVIRGQLKQQNKLSKLRMELLQALKLQLEHMLTFYKSCTVKLVE